jgi:Bacterial PH domain
MPMSTATISMAPQAISGVSPAQTQEATVMTVWPSVAKYGLGRALGSLFAIRWPDVYIFRLGHLIALMSIPIALVLFFMRIAPKVATRYRLTNRRIIVERGIMGVFDKAVDLDRFDSILIEVQPGQAWYDAGDLVFRLGNLETFRLEGVSRPAVFRETCLKSHMAAAGVKRARQGR